MWWKYARKPLLYRSLSARRAWIEIRTKGGKVKIESVALRKESVDRNSELWSTVKLAISRSPQGERG